jgi:hypothetical protein
MCGHFRGHIAIWIVDTDSTFDVFLCSQKHLTPKVDIVTGFPSRQDQFDCACAEFTPEQSDRNGFVQGVRTYSSDNRQVKPENRQIRLTFIFKHRIVR